MTNNNPRGNKKLDSESADKLHAAWLQALERNAVAHMEFRDAKQQLRKALDNFEAAQEHNTLMPDAREAVDRRLLRSIRVEKKKREAARTARDAENKAREAMGLPPMQASAADLDDDELQVGAGK